MRDLILSTVVMGIHRGLLLRNRVFGFGAPVYGGVTATVRRCRIEVGTQGQALDAQMVLASADRPQAAVLLLHGIGETVEHWEAVQQMFAAEGVASLVVDYRGFGRTGGWFSTERAELDALAGYAFLERQLPGVPIALVGFSLGCGAAAAVCGRTRADLLALCAGYPSLRKAVRAIGLPTALTWLMRDVWRAESEVATCGVPVLIVHGAADRLFPSELARRVADTRVSDCELRVVAGVSHDDPIFRPSMAFWGPVLDRIKRVRDSPAMLAGGL